MKTLGSSLTLISSLFLIAPVADAAQRAAPAPKFGPLSKPEQQKLDRVQQRQDRVQQKAHLDRVLAQAKAQVKHGKPILKRQQQLEKQAARNVKALAEARTKAATQLAKLDAVYQADKSARNEAVRNSAQADYNARFIAHANAVTQYKLAQSSLQRTRRQRFQAIDTLVQAQRAVKRGPPRVALPTYAQAAQLPAAVRPQGFAVAPAMNGVYGPGPRIQRTNNYDDAADVRANAPFLSPYTPGPLGANPRAMALPLPASQAAQRSGGQYVSAIRIVQNAVVYGQLND